MAAAAAAAARRTYVLEDDDGGGPTGAAPIAAAVAGGDAAGLIRSIRMSIVGEFDAIPAPLGPRKLTYVDHTATGRLVGFLERYMLEEVAPLYANTHTTTSYTGFASHSFLAEARGIMREAVNASDRDDCVLFTGRGATAAVNVLAHHLAGGRASGGGGGCFACPYPGCGRTFAARPDAQLHARTHPDGEQAAHNIREVTPPGGTPAPAADGTVHVVVGPWVHHSSLLPWREAGAHVRVHLLNQQEGAAPTVASPQAAGEPPATSAHVELARELHATLLGLAGGSAASVPPPRRVVCVFAATSNVTGALLPPDAIDALCAVAHAHGAVTAWDYAAAAPHVGPVDVNPRRKVTLREALQLDGAAASGAVALGALSPDTPHSTVKHAVYFSGHKLTGGPGAPGVLVVKRSLMAPASAAASGSAGTIPHAPGGGTVFFVHPDGTPRYLANDEEREEAGSPDTLGAVRGALAMHLARSVGWRAIAAREGAMAAVARRAWAAHPRIRIVGAGGGPRTPVVSFVVAAPPGRLHHWGFIAAALNDLFGIQARGGCLCAGPFVQRLLGWPAGELEALEAALLAKDELLRPGVVRVSFPFTMSHAAFRHVLRAVLWVATHADALLGLYQPIAETGEWRLHRSAAGSAVAEALRTAAPGGRSAGPREVIAAATRGGGVGGATAGGAVSAASHADAAQRGAFKAHPRRWLQEARFDAATGLPSWPVRRMTVAVVEAPPPPAGCPPPAVTEAALYAAYEAEAALLVDGLRASTSSAPPPDAGAPAALYGAAAQHHDPASLLSPSAQPLRWFALSGDAGRAPPGGGVDYAERVQAWAEPPAAPTGGSRTGAGGYWLTPPPDAVAVLSTDTPTPSQLAAWDGEATTLGQTQADDPVVAVPELRDGAPLSRGGAPSAPRPGQKRGPPPRAGDDALADAGGGSGGSALVDALAVPPPAKRASRAAEPEASAVAGGAAAASAATAIAATAAGDPAAAAAGGGGGGGAPRGSVASALKRDPNRIAAIKATCAAIAKLPPPPPALARALTKAMSRAIKDFDMIREGDKLMVGLSGGKDSLTLLILLAGLRARAPVAFDLAAATVDPQYPGFDPSPLKDFCAGLGIPYFYESQPVIAAAGTHMTTDSICAWCSRMKRGILYSTMRREGYNVLVLGQHLDDCAESFLMSAMRNGLLRTMKAHYVCDDGDLRIVRPLVYARERLTREFATACALPVINENCPACYVAPTERYHVKKLLAGEEALHPTLFGCLEQAIRPLMTTEGALAVKAAAAVGGPAAGASTGGTTAAGASAMAPSARVGGVDRIVYVPSAARGAGAGAARGAGAAPAATSCSLDDDDE